MAKNCVKKKKAPQKQYGIVYIGKRNNELCLMYNNIVQNLASELWEPLCYTL